MLAALRPALVLTSDLSRAADTAAPLARLAGREPEVDVRLRERDAGEWEGLTRAEIAERHPADWAAFLAHEDRPFGGGESDLDLAARVVPVLHEVAGRLEPGQTAVLVTHGAAARHAVARVLGLDVTAARRLAALGNTRWSTLGVDGRGWQLQQHGAGVDPAPAPVPPPLLAADATALPPPEPARPR